MQMVTRPSSTRFPSNFPSILSILLNKNLPNLFQASIFILQDEKNNSILKKKICFRHSPKKTLVKFNF